jgi:hypothetical protein
VHLCEIATEDVDGYDLSLDIGGTLEGFIKNGSTRVLREVDAHIVVRNARKDIVFQSQITIRCDIPPGEARHFSHRNAVPSQSISCKYNPNGREEWTLEGSFETYMVAARGERDIFDQIHEQKLAGVTTDGFRVKYPQHNDTNDQELTR